MAKKEKQRKLFGISIKTKAQKRFWKWFMVLKAVIYTIIFILCIIFLLKLRSVLYS